MPDWSRRRALHATASAAAIALAGCSAERSSSGSGYPSAEGKPVTDYEVEKGRNDDGEALFWRSDVETPSETASERDPEQRRRRRQSQYQHVTETADFEELEFATGLSAATRLREFATATDLESESVFLLQRGIPACSSLRLLEVRRKADSVHVDTCSELRPADVECAADGRAVVALAIRLPFPGDSFNGMGAGWSSSCRERPTAFDPEAYNGTAEGSGGESS